MSWNALCATEGGGAYVWGSFGMCFTLMAAEVVGLRRRIRRARAAFAAAAPEGGLTKGDTRDSDLLIEETVQ